ncbi:MAG TPA: hypothetical protein VMZ66_13765 [Aeromicrobium sp.]|nr:hypothetical protein [Aeromicrobium sp.]
MVVSKVPPLSAVAIVVLFIAGTASLGTPIPVDASPAETIAWLKAHQSDVPVAVASFALSVIPFFVLVAWVRRALPDVYGYAFLAAAGAAAAQIVISSWFVAGAALHADSIDPMTARSLLDVGAYFGPVLTTTDVVMAGAVALAALREGSLPRWLGWISAVFAVEQLAETATIFGTSGFAAPGGDWNNMLGAGLFVVWIVALGFGLRKRVLPAA